MKPLTQDLSVFKKFDFERPPVGISFLLNRPEGVEPLDKTLAFCEMLKESHQMGEPFYITAENDECFGKITLGMEDMPPFAEAGCLGPELEVFQDARANSRLYTDLPRLGLGTVKYVLFAPLDKMTFEPDLLVITAVPGQAEIILRAMSYSTGEGWESKSDPVLGCVWLYIYPYVSGKINYIMTGMTFGMKAREVFPEGLVLISIPYNWIPVIVRNLEEMKWVLPSYTEGREKFVARFSSMMDKLAKNYENS